MKWYEKLLNFEQPPSGGLLGGTGFQNMLLGASAGMANVRPGAAQHEFLGSIMGGAQQGLMAERQARAQDRALQSADLEDELTRAKIYDLRNPAVEPQAQTFSADQVAAKLNVDPSMVPPGLYNWTADKGFTPLTKDPLVSFEGANFGANLENTTGTQTGLESGILESTDVLSRMDDIWNSWDPAFSELATQLENWSLDKLERAGVPLTDEQKAGLGAYTTWATNTRHNMNRTLNELSGAAISPAEAQRLMAELPTVDDGPTVFRSKLKTLMRGLRKKIARYDYARRKGLNVSNYEQLEKSMSMQQFEEEFTATAEAYFNDLMATKNVSEEEAEEATKTYMRQTFGWF